MRGGGLRRAGITLALAAALLGGVQRVQASSVRYVDVVLGRDTDNLTCEQNQPCQTVGWAIAGAYPGDTILIAPGTYEENLTINKSLTLQGSENGSVILDGNGKGRVLWVNAPSSEVALVDLIVQHGAADMVNGAGVLLQAGSLTVQRVTLTDNESTASGGGLACTADRVVVRQSTLRNNQAPRGGGVWVGENCSLDMEASSVRGNQGVMGAGMWISGVAALRNVTVSANAVGSPAAPETPPSVVAVDAEATLTCSHCTLANNIQQEGDVSLRIAGAFSIRSSLLYETYGEPCSNLAGQLVSLGYNLDGNGNCGLHGVGDLDLNGADPFGSGLADHGGGTFTLALGADSPAVDAACPQTEDVLMHDQRGLAYQDGNFDGVVRGDIGAYEYQPAHTWLAFVVH